MIHFLEGDQNVAYRLTAAASLPGPEQVEIIAELRGVVADIIGERLRNVSEPGMGLASHEALTAPSRFSLLDDPLLRVSPKCMEG